MVFVDSFLIVFNMIPDTVSIGNEVITNRLILCNNILSIATKLQPPVTIIHTGTAGHGGPLILLRVGRIITIDGISHLNAVDTFR